ncbi:odorant receptor 4-like [Phlebotomus argentipes]|uniref:odorant receptor 4-like n=1 Tax=Phlebotomus argentipes TaxID=94469 RepID=UPI00289299C6|nr:odorant receptor 4-like [Phlebotomus argentipes]
MSKEGLKFDDTIFYIRLLYSTIGLTLSSGFPLSHDVSETLLKRLLKKLYLCFAIVNGLVLTVDLFFYIVLKNRHSINVYEILTQIFIGMYFISAVFKTLMMVHLEYYLLPLEVNKTVTKSPSVTRRVFPGYPACNEFSKETFLAKIRRNAIFICLYTWGSLMTLGVVLRVFLTTTGGFNVWELLSQIVVSSYFAVAWVKMLDIIMNRNNLAAILQDLANLWPQRVNSEQEKIIVESYMMKNTVWMTRYAYLSVSCFLTVNSTPLFIMLISYLSGGDAKTLLPFSGWFPFDEFSPSIYPFTYIYLFYGSHVGSVSSMCFDVLFCMLLSHLSMHYKLLRYDIISSVKDNEDEVNLQKCIKKHQSLIDLRSKIDHIFTNTIFFNFCFSTFNMCIVGFFFMIQDGFGKTKFVLMFATLMSQVFLLCWYGQELVDNSSKISDAAYNCSWYASTHRFRKMILYIMQHSQRPQILVAMKFWEISLSSFSMLLRASWSYFALLNTILDEIMRNVKPEGGLLTN